MIGASENDSDAADLSPVNHDALGHQRLLVVRAAASLCAVPLDNVIEVMRALPVRPVTSAPNYVCGLSIVRGEAIPVVDVGLLVGSDATERRRLVTVRTGGRTIALAASDVLGVQSILVGELKDLPPLLHEAGNDTIAAIGTVDAELLYFLRTTRVIPWELFDRLAAEGSCRE
jgi:purine-binding chemotaxis protein CheW